MAPKKSGFILFVTEWRQKNNPKLDLTQAIKKAEPFWQKMSMEEREAYRRKSHHSNAANLPKTVQKLTCIGTSIASETEKQCDQLKKALADKRTIFEDVHQSLQANEFECRKYYFIMTNYFVQKRKTEEYIPAEVSVSEYSLKLGVNRVFHTLINPGNCLYGHLSEATEHSQRTHNLPLPPHALGDTNLNGIFEKICQFIQTESSAELPAVYTLTEHISIVESALKYIQLEKPEDGYEPIKLKIYPIEYLFYVMKMISDSKRPSDIEREMNKDEIVYKFSMDSFEYCSDIGCGFHEDKDLSNFCTQSYVTRWGYMFADIARKMQMTLSPGRHLPHYIMHDTSDQCKPAVDDIQLQTGTSAGLRPRRERGRSRGDLLLMTTTKERNKIG